MFEPPAGKTHGLLSCARCNAERIELLPPLQAGLDGWPACCGRPMLLREPSDPPASLGEFFAVLVAARAELSDEEYESLLRELFSGLD